MKKLNNKGFAISTMLYGILTMIILVFTLLLNIMRASYNKENAAADNITYYLNKCISKQVALEDCYKTYDDDPSNPKSCTEEYEAYTTCVGKSSNLGSASSSTVRLMQLALGFKDTSGLQVDNSYSDGVRYVYKGTNPNNYIKYGNKLARIISIEPDNKIKIIFTDSFDAVLDNEISDADNGTAAWKNSKMIATLEKKFESISYSDKLVKSSFNTATIYTSSSITDTLATIYSESTSEYKYGLINVADYVKASNSSSCDLTTGTTANALTNCKANNWLNTTQCQWTMTGVASGGEISTYVTVKTDGYETKAPTNTCKTKLVAYLPETATAGANGTGTQENPFVISLD